jgi:hypothetical protein
MKTSRKIALIALLWITVIDSGTLGSIDTKLRLKMAHAWWTGTEEVSPDYQPSERGDLLAGVKGVGGKRYISYDLGQSLLMLPGDWLGTQLYKRFPVVKSQDFRGVVIKFLIFIPLNVAAVVSCFLLLRLFDFEEQIAGLTSIAWLLGTTVWHYAQVPHQNNQVLLFVTIGYAAALAFVKHGRPRFVWISGLALGAALLIRASSIIHVLTVLLFLVGCIAYQSRDKVKVLKVAGLWVVGFMPLLLLGRMLEYIRYGSFWVTGQSLLAQQLTTDPIWSGLPEMPANFPFINPPYVGILGVLFSAAKSIFIYDPLLLPCLMLGIVLWKKLSPYMQWYLVTGILNLGLHMALTSRLAFWHGDWAWGARYHVTSIHLLLIPLLGLFIHRLLSARKLTLWLMRGILTIAIIVQIASVTMPYSLEFLQDQDNLRNNLKVTQGISWSSSLQFRLGMRGTNIVCLIDNSFSEKCVNRLSPDKKRQLEDHNRVNFLPFTISRELAGKPSLIKISLIFFVVWGLLLTLAIGTTVWFCFVG